MNSRTSDDRQLMVEVSAGNVDAFEQLVDRLWNRAYRVAYAVCHDDARTQAALEEAFVSLWTGRTSYRPNQGSVAAWLLTAVQHQANDLAQRNTNPSARLTGKNPFQRRSTLDDTDNGHPAADARLQDSLAQLPDDQREVIALAYYGELSHTEIATQLGLPAGTVKGRMRLGLQKLHADIASAA